MYLLREIIFYFRLFLVPQNFGVFTGTQILIVSLVFAIVSASKRACLQKQLIFLVATEIWFIFTSYVNLVPA